jgi:tRNA dimethylallyltransferase
MTEQAVAATRQLAKRQFTWLRRDRDAVWLDSDLPDVTHVALKCVKGIPIHTETS